MSVESIGTPHARSADPSVTASTEMDPQILLESPSDRWADAALRRHRACALGAHGFARFLAAAQEDR